MDWKRFIKEEALDKNGQLVKSFIRSGKYRPLIKFLAPLQGASILEKLYLFYSGAEPAVCECGSGIPFLRFSLPYKQFCSRRCARRSPKTWKAYRETCLKKYGTESANAVGAVLAKKRATWNSKTADEKKEVSKRMVATRIKRHGKYLDTESVKRTKRDRYGDANYNNAPKMKSTMLSRHGVESPMQHPRMKRAVIEGRRRRTKENMFKKINGLPTVEPLFGVEDYVSIHYQNKYPWRCKACGTAFKDDLYAARLPRCPTCFPLRPAYSKEECEIADWLESMGLEVRRGDRSLIAPLEVDLYVPSVKLAIEFDGLYWHSELMGKPKRYHLGKTRSCASKGVRLLHVFSDEWAEKRPIVQSIIRSKCGIHGPTLGARRCDVREVHSPSKFLCENHIQGSARAAVSYGLFFGDELVSLLCMSSPRFTKGAEWEITRFCNKLDAHVSGSFSRLFKAFLVDREPTSVVTYSDLRWFDGAVYLQSGFKFVESTEPSYFYTDYQARHSRVKFQKHKLLGKLKVYDLSLSEWQNMQLNGWDRIWDCGCNKYLFLSDTEGKRL